MHFTTTNLGVASAAWIASFFVGVGGVDVIQTYTATPAPRQIQLVSLDYRDGKIGQDLIVSGAPEVPARWTALIRRPGRVGSVCDGSGNWNYPKRNKGDVKWFTPDEWTGGTCPPLQVGDELSVTYEYTTVEGFVTVSGGNLKITKEMMK